MIRIQPLGSKLLVLPIEVQQENFKTEAGIEIVENEIERATVVEVGTDVKNVFKKGQIVIMPPKRGVTKIYNGKQHFLIDGLPHNQGGDVYGIEIEEKPVIDKGDGL